MRPLLARRRCNGRAAAIRARLDVVELGVNTLPRTFASGCPRHCIGAHCDPVVGRGPYSGGGYGVSGTPTFVLLDGAGEVRSYATGYTPEKVLGIGGWSWTKTAGG